MFRTLLSALAMFTASACTIGLPSAVDAVPFGARLATPALPDGVYCALDKVEDDGSLIVLSAEEEGDDNHCAAIKWDPESRLFTASDESGRKPEVVSLAFADLGDGLLLMQFENGDGSSEEPWRYTLMAAVTHGGAMGILPLVMNDETLSLAVRYPELKFESYRVPFLTPNPPEGTPEGAEPPPSPHRYIASGSPEHARHLARDIARFMLQRASQEAEQNGVSLQNEWGLPTLLRDQTGQPDHPPTPEQLNDIAALQSLVARLAAQ